MIPYVIAFLLSIITAFLGEKLTKKNKLIGIIVLVISVLPIVIIGGLRTIDMGWDTQLYVVPVFNDVKNLNLSQLNNYMSIREIEPGFIFLIFLLSKIFSNINFVLFGLISIISYSVLYYAYKNRDKTSIVFVLFLYEMVLYPITYSTLRQCTAMALIFIACIKFIDKKYIKAMLLLLISQLFHSSSYMAIILFIIIYINDSKVIPEKRKKMLFFITLLLTAIGVLYYENVMNYLYSIGILNSKYLAYIGSKFQSETISIRWPLLLYKMFNILIGFLYFCCKAIPKEEKDNNKKWYILLLFDFIITLFSFKIVNAHRTTYYVLFPSLFVFIPQTTKIFKDDGISKKIGYLLIIVVYALYFITSLNYYDIYPYRWIL